MNEFNFVNIMLQSSRQKIYIDKLGGMCSKTGLYLKRIVLDSQLQQIYKYSTTFTIHDVKLYYVYTKTNQVMHKNTVHTVRVCAATFPLRGVFTDFTLPGVGCLMQNCPNPNYSCSFFHFMLSTSDVSLLKLTYECLIKLIAHHKRC